MNENGQPVGKFVKFLQFPLIRIILGFAVVILAPALAQAGAQAVVGVEGTFAKAIIVLLSAAAALLGYYGFVRLIERRSVSELSLPQAPAEWGGGFLLGAALFSITILILW